ncbi:hypothetical protein T484DRAFT_1911319 [Baffinella frigidus]|nr:hypothetical protein T484DRAFT_1911319 [Cryptophyta sp. CCMP2293]
MAGQPTTGFARGGWQGDAISDMIEDSEKALKGLPAKPPPDGPDPKSLKDAFLETSPHFQAMLQALEVFDSSVSSGGPAPAKYEQALFSALRTMLRECLFTKNAGLRKHHIDRVHTWFVDKRMATDQSAHMAAAPTGPTEKPLVNTWNASMAIRPSTAGQLDGRRTTAVESAAARPYTGELARAMSAEPPISHGADEDGASGGAKLPPKERIKEYRMRNLRVSQMRRAGIPIQSIRAAEDAAKQMHQANRHAAEAELDGAVADEATDRAIRELWLSKREAEEMERRSEQEVQDAIAVWAHQRARVEEEVSRRQESIRYASQTALLHARPATAVHHMMQGAIAEEGSMMLGMSSTRSPGHRPGTARSGRASVGVRSPGLRNDVSIQSDDSDDDTVEIVEDMIKAAALPDKFHKIPLLKAPYDGLRHANTPAGWPISSLARPISARLAGHDPDSFFGRASNGSSPRLFNRTAPARPQTAGARFALGTTIAAYDETR